MISNQKHQTADERCSLLFVENLGRRVFRRAEHAVFFSHPGPAVGGAGARGAGHEVGQLLAVPKVSELDARLARVVREQHVLDLDVAVDHAVGVQVRDRGERLPHDAARLRVGYAAAKPAHAVMQVAARADLHHEPDPLRLDEHVEELHDVPVAQPLVKLALAHDSLGRRGVRRELTARNHLHRDRNAVRATGRARDDGRTAPSNHLGAVVVVEFIEVQRLPMVAEPVLEINIL